MGAAAGALVIAALASTVEVVLPTEVEVGEAVLATDVLSASATEVSAGKSSFDAT